MKAFNFYFYMESLNYSETSLQILQVYIYIVYFCSYWLSPQIFPKCLHFWLQVQLYKY